MRTIAITIQDKDHGEYISARVVESYDLKIDEEYLISLIRKAEKDLEKLIWQRELTAVQPSTILKNEKK
jgi:hypothetical protein